MAQADELRRLGYGGDAARLAVCGKTCVLRDCLSCGEGAAAVEITATCSLRTCPHCARKRARELGVIAADAARRAPGYQSLAEASVVAELRALEAEAEAARDEYLHRGGIVLGRVERRRLAKRAAEDHALAGRYGARAAAAEKRRADAARQRYDVGARPSWSWKLLTISPQWPVGDPEALTVGGLRRRAEDVWQRWLRVWSLIGAGGLAYAMARVELSDLGHVHVHILYLGPWYRDDVIAEAAGCFIDVKMVEDDERDQRDGLSGDALTEAAKYTVKMPTPTDAAWLSGARAEVIHPELAARWSVAMRGARTVRWYGIAVDCRRAAEAATAEDPDATPRPHSCPRCGVPVLTTGGRRARLVDAARELHARGVTRLGDRFVIIRRPEGA